MLTRNYSDNYQMDVVQRINATTTYSTLLSTVLGTRTGQSEPGWRERIRLGQDASTPFSCNRSRIEGLKPASVTHNAAVNGNPASGLQKQYWSGLPTALPSTINHLLPDQATAEADALTKLYKKLQAQLQQWQGASFVAEAADVLHQFGHPLQSIIDLTNRRLNMLGLAARGLSGSTAFRKVKWAEIVASTWLEYAFGLAPLISDTRKAAEAVARWRNDEEVNFLLRSKVVARGQSVKTAHSDATVPYGSTWVYGVRSDKTTTTFKVQYVAGVAHSMLADFGSNDRLIQLCGFEPKDWIPAAWEVVPWSWLIDYFTNVGDILTAAVTSTADVTWCNKTVTQETVYEYQTAPSVAATAAFMASNAPWKTIAFLGSPGGYTFVRKTVDRTIGVKPGVPPLVFGLPSMWGQFANMVAVLISKRPQSSALWLI